MDIPSIPDMSFSPFDDSMGTEIIEMSEHRVELHTPVTEQLHQPAGLVHGGVYCTLAESAASIGGSLASREVTGSPTTAAVGQSNHTDFLKATRSGSLTTVATPVHVGRSVQLWEVKIHNADSELVATSKVRLFNVDLARISS